ncbi:type II toxin-antitoxin system RelE/ParE family toxin [Fulvivirga sp. RKSG066]|nr:type II toxin-antitoxin system RelE/ParE family toxin [Fulvivirga aurantia]
MTGRQVVWTQTAASQRRSILEYWINRNKSNNYSIKILRLSNDKTKVIAQNPKLFRLADFPDTHMAAMGHFSIFYKFNAKEVIITAFWDNRQDPKKLLKELYKSK